MPKYLHSPKKSSTFAPSNIINNLKTQTTMTLTEIKNNLTFPFVINTEAFPYAVRITSENDFKRFGKQLMREWGLTENDGIDVLNDNQYEKHGFEETYFDDNGDVWEFIHTHNIEEVEKLDLD